jgi:hypothetical protein
VKFVTKNVGDSKLAYAYTPGLKVKKRMKVSKLRQLPIFGEVFFNVGDKVNYDTIIARTDIPGNPEMVNIGSQLSVVPKDIPLLMKKKEGDQVAKGEVIAAYKALWGLINKTVTSPIDGILETISDISGQAIIRGRPRMVEVEAYIPGKVIKVLPREGVVIETNAAYIQGIFGIGGEAHGEIKVAVESPDDELTADRIVLEDKGKVLIGGSIVTLEALEKGLALGVSSIVVGGVRHDDVTRFMGEEIGVAITGHEEVELTLIITEGFGKMRMSQRTFDLFMRFDGYLASLNGATQIRAGVMRPEIIIPHEESFEQVLSEELASGMIPGTPIRIIRKPYFGAIGKVVSLPVALQQVQSLSYVRVLEVELEDGRIVTVPRANVEIIEE